MTRSVRRWPSQLLIVRHGESAGNVARDRAYANAATTIEIDGRDADVPLSPRGHEQSAALGAWLRDEIVPDAILCSPFVRARETAAGAIRAAGWSASALADERLREKEFGVLDRLTHRGIVERFPIEAEQRRLLGKFYYRPPGGESWADVILRVRSFVEMLPGEHPAGCVFVVTHQVVVLALRYVLERLDESALLAIDRAGDVANCGLTRYRVRVDGALELVAYNSVAPLTERGAAVTREPSADHAT